VSSGQGRQVLIISRPLEGSGGGTFPWQRLRHWAVIVGDRYYELLPTDNAIPHVCSGSLHGSQIRLNVGFMPLDPRTWTSMESRGWTNFDNEEIHNAGVFALK